MPLQTQDPHTFAPDCDNREWLSLRELANRLGISLTAAYEYARTDTLPIPAIRVGRQFRFSRRAYEALTSAQHPNP